MMVTVRLFAIFRERAGRDTVELDLADGATVADALEELSTRPELAEILERMPVRMAVNRDYADEATILAPGDELALVPPVSGGAGGAEDVHARVSAEPLSLDAISRSVARPGAGAIVSFQGTTREVTRLEYEAYSEMAQERIAAILRDCVSNHGLEAAAAEHRIGDVPLGEPSVVVAVSAAHRGEAFAGAREAIDRIKAEAPIWKREVSAGPEGEQGRWVQGTPPPASMPENGER
ncbi:MAG: MoaD family protein [Solirubrobacterales bacterium]|nr:MoaD family protein [Solirubrobacterales bacterium]